MNTRVLTAAALALAAASVAAAAPDSGKGWKVHDRARPRPAAVTPPPQSLPLPPPSDAVVLFNGKGLSEWTGEQGGGARWKVDDGVLTIAPGTGGIATRRAFGDVQLHLEWAAPVPAVGKSQGRGNSGIHLMGQYEVQILDSYGNDTYADGQAAAIYGQYPPLVNASRPPGEWQSYDIFFRAPRFDPEGDLLKRARVTVVHNGVLVQDNVELLGPTVWLHYQPYKAHAEKLPFTLQEHGNPVRFRNIWARELKETPAVIIRQEPRVTRPNLDLKRYVGTYRARMGSRDENVTVTARDGRLYFGIPFRDQALEMVPVSAREFTLRTTDARLLFDLDSNGTPTSFAFSVAGDQAFVARRAP
jgi:hypothetical protein